MSSGLYGPKPESCPESYRTCGECRTYPCREGKPATRDYDWRAAIDRLRDHTDMAVHRQTHHPHNDVEELAAHIERVTRERDWLAGELYDADYLDLYTRAARSAEDAPYTAGDRAKDIAYILAVAKEATKDECDL
jgi:hypothetical protein